MKKDLNQAQRREAIRRAKEIARSNPLRRVRITCHGWVRDPMAVVGDWLWCETCADSSRVIEVVE